jgi:pimeloyl-ACP methyl ester carboxylesterase
MKQAPEGRPGIRQFSEPLWQDVHRVEHKTLIVYGRENRSSWDGALWMISRMPNAEFHFSKCGFWVQYEKAAEFNSLVKSFLNS